VLEANGFPAPGTPKHAPLTEQFPPSLATAASDGDDWAKIGALLVAKNFLSSNGKSNATYVGLMGEAVEALKRQGVSAAVLPPYIVRNWNS